MNVRNRWVSRLLLTTAAVAATVIATTVVHPQGSAHASDTLSDNTVTAQDVVDAVDNVPDGLVQDALVVPGAVAEGTDGQSTAPLYLDIPANASEGVGLTAGDFSLSIGLPNADEASKGARVSGGATAYPSEGDSANAVVPVRGGVQLLSVIEGVDADETYSYPLTLPDGHSLESTPDGGAQIIDARGTVKVVFEPAWAKDAAGVDVPTHYEVHGDTLSQVVEHRSASDVSYPVVADPLPVILIVVTAAAAIVVAAAALGIATWIVVNWWNYCRARGQYPQLSTRNGFTARCVS